MEKKELSRIRIVLAEQNKTNRCLAEQLKVSEDTVFKLVTNTQQPLVETFYKISVLLKADLRKLFISMKGLIIIENWKVILMKSAAKDRQ